MATTKSPSSKGCCAGCIRATWDIGQFLAGGGEGQGEATAGAAVAGDVPSLVESLAESSWMTSASTCTPAGEGCDKSLLFGLEVSGFTPRIVALFFSCDETIRRWAAVRTKGFSTLVSTVRDGVPALTMMDPEQIRDTELLASTVLKWCECFATRIRCFADDKRNPNDETGGVDNCDEKEKNFARAPRSNWEVAFNRIPFGDKVRLLAQVLLLLDRVRGETLALKEGLLQLAKDGQSIGRSITVSANDFATVTVRLLLALCRIVELEESAQHQPPRIGVAIADEVRKGLQNWLTTADKTFLPRVSMFLLQRTCADYVDRLAAVFDGEYVPTDYIKSIKESFSHGGPTSQSIRSNEDPLIWTLNTKLKIIQPTLLPLHICRFLLGEQDPIDFFLSQEIVREKQPQGAYLPQFRSALQVTTLLADLLTIAIGELVKHPTSKATPPIAAVPAQLNALNYSASALYGVLEKHQKNVFSAISKWLSASASFRLSSSTSFSSRGSHGTPLVPAFVGLLTLTTVSVLLADTEWHWARLATSNRQLDQWGTLLPTLYDTCIKDAPSSKGRESSGPSIEHTQRYFVATTMKLSLFQGSLLKRASTLPALLRPGVVRCLERVAELTRGLKLKTTVPPPPRGTHLEETLLPFAALIPFSAEPLISVLAEQVSVEPQAATLAALVALRIAWNQSWVQESVAPYRSTPAEPKRIGNGRETGAVDGKSSLPSLEVAMAVPQALRSNVFLVLSQCSAWHRIFQALGPEVNSGANTFDSASLVSRAATELWELALVMILTISCSAVEADRRRDILNAMIRLPKTSTSGPKLRTLTLLALLHWLRTSSSWQRREFVSGFGWIAEAAEFALKSGAPQRMDDEFPKDWQSALTALVAKLPTASIEDLQIRCTDTCPWLMKMGILPRPMTEEERQQAALKAESMREAGFKQFERLEQLEQQRSQFEKKALEAAAGKQYSIEGWLKPRDPSTFPPKAQDRMGKVEGEAPTDAGRKRGREIDVDDEEGLVDQPASALPESLNRFSGPPILDAEALIKAELATSAKPAVALPRNAVKLSTLEKQDASFVKRELEDDLDLMLEAALLTVIRTKPDTNPDDSKEVAMGICTLHTKFPGATAAGSEQAEADSSVLVAGAIQKIPRGRFEDKKKFSGFFLPYCLLELRSSLLQDYQAGAEKPARYAVARVAEPRIQGTVATVVLQRPQTAGSVEKKTEPSQTPISRLFSERDIVVLQFPSEQQPQPNQAHSGKGGIVCFGVVQQRQGKGLTLAVGANMKDHLLHWSTARHGVLFRLSSLNQTDQMLQTLHTVRTSPFWSYFGKAPQQVGNSATALVTREGEVDLNSHLKNGNRSQLDAIQAVLRSGSNSITCIVGPPGTGKTSTICGMVSAILSQPQRDARGLKANVRVLVCAPSNAAVDAAMLRLRERGIFKDGKYVVPAMVRIGVKEKIHPEVLQQGLYLEDIVEVRIRHMARSGQGGEPLLTSGVTADELERRRREKVKALLDAKVIFSTLGSIPALLKDCPIDTAIVDEVTQAVEPQGLIPLSLAVRRCVYVGDPSQLRATVVAPLSQRGGFDIGVMERLVENGVPTHLLDTQYRMHPDISRFANKTFYEGRLSDADQVKHRALEPLLRPAKPELFPKRMLFTNVDGRENASRFTSSRSNDGEAKAIAAFLTNLPQILGAGEHWQELYKKLVVLTFYAAQVQSLRRALPLELQALVEIKTVDSFQGQEREIVILSCVRSSVEKGEAVVSAVRRNELGFVSNPNRMNVSLTRAREFCFVFGNKATLLTDTFWSTLIEGFCAEFQPML